MTGRDAARAPTERTGAMPTELSPREMLARFVSFDTVSSKSNLPLAHFVRDVLAEHGVGATLVPDETGEKANLYATIGPQAEGGVVLSGHLDVVPVEGQPWTTDPFTLTERDGRLHGRGTADMKSFSAIALALVPEMLRKDLKRPIHLALSHDEEVGCVGAPAMIRHMREHIAPPAAVIVGEPTELAVVTHQKATFSMRTEVTGRPVHSSQVDRGVSAVAIGARCVAFLDDILRENMAKPRTDLPFDPPFTTVHTGMISGGTAHNIVARHCAFVTDVRALPDEDPRAIMERYRRFVAERLEPGMKAIDPETGVDIRVRADVPGLSPQEDTRAEELCRRLTGDNGVHGVSYGTEAGQFHRDGGGWSVVVCGPGSIDQAHQPDEFITIDQFEKGVAFARRLIDDLAR